MSAANGMAAHVGREQTVEALGKSWTLARWDRAVWDKFLIWAATKIPDPRETAKDMLAMLPNTPDNQEVRSETVRWALNEKQQYLSPNSPQVIQLLGTLDGVCKIVELLMKPAHPEADESLSYEIVLAVGQTAAEEKLKLTAGIAPAPKGDGAESPGSRSANPSPDGSSGPKLTPVSSGKPD